MNIYTGRKNGKSLLMGKYKAGGAQLYCTKCKAWYPLSDRCRICGGELSSFFMPVPDDLMKELVQGFIKL